MYLILALNHEVSVVTKFGLVVARPVREVGEPSQQPWSHPQEDGQVLSCSVFFLLLLGRSLR